ncbi:MAG: hypothetical protein RXP77_04895 [Nitrososphaeria archaeon]
MMLMVMMLVKQEGSGRRRYTVRARARRAAQATALVGLGMAWNYLNAEEESARLLRAIMRGEYEVVTRPGFRAAEEMLEDVDEWRVTGVRYNPSGRNRNRPTIWVRIADPHGRAVRVVFMERRHGV